MGRFCFISMIRDEEPVIRRCITSVKNIVDSYFITDTGSIDRTIEIVQNSMEQYNIPGKIVSVPWISYGDNRTTMLRMAREENPNAEYFIWLDADEVFTMDLRCEIYPSVQDGDKLYRLLKLGGYEIISFKSTLYNTIYWRTQIVKNCKSYVYRLPFQEYLDCSGSKVYKSEFMYNLARKEGNSSRDPDIWKKRIEMSEKWLEGRTSEDRDYSRMLFYLAEAYTLAKDGEKAFDTYKQYLGISEYPEEMYVAMIRMSRLLPNSEKIPMLFRAINLCPNNLDAIHELMMVYSRDKNWKLAAAIADMAPPIVDGVRPTRGLFPYVKNYEYRFDLEASIVYHNNGQLSKGRELAYSVYNRCSYPSGELKPDIPEAVSTNLKHFNSTITPKLFIIDNWHSDPDSIRKRALGMKFDTTGNYPGVRTVSDATLDDKLRFEKIIGKRIINWPGDYNGSYQLTTSKDISWKHRDVNNMAAIIYLTPSAPIDSGTSFYKHIPTQETKSTNKETEKQMLNDTYRDDKWELIDSVGNLYNRLVIFQGQNTHTSSNYFGDSLDDGRLFQIFFFDVDQ